MANQEHLAILKQGVEVWNQWRKEHDHIQPNLRGAQLNGANLRHADLCAAILSYAHLSNADLYEAELIDADLDKANLSGADLHGATLVNADLYGANLSNADLSGANLCEANLRKANLSKANLIDTNLSKANISEADLSEADLIDANLGKAKLNKANLSGADLSRATLVETNLAEATLSNCHIYGIAAWGMELRGAQQNNLVITPYGKPTVTVDNLKLAQFIYLLLNNAEIREVIDTITSKVVLILGRFTPERKAVLDALRDELRKHNYSPVLFDFEKPASRDLTGTVSTLAHLARFIIVDLTDPSSAPHEVATVIPQTVVPVQPLMLAGQRAYSMFRDLEQRYHWVLPTYCYSDQAHLLATLPEHIIAPAEQKALELKERMEKK